MEDFMDFTQKHPKAMTNDDIVQCMRVIFNSSSPDESKKRKQFCPISSYPRNLKIIVTSQAQVDISRWERDTSSCRRQARKLHCSSHRQVPRTVWQCS